MRLNAFVPVALLVVAGALPRPALAAWPTDTAVNVAVSADTVSQDGLTIISDGAGGSILGWTAYHDGVNELRAQRLDSLGVPRWSAGGVHVSAAGAGTRSPAFVSDGAGGLIAGWLADGNAVYSQRVGADGVRRWAADLLVSFSAGRTDYLSAVPDGEGGAVFAWCDVALDWYSLLFAERVSAAGERLWPSAIDHVPPYNPRGMLFGQDSVPIEPAHIASDGTGGMIATWCGFGWTRPNAWVQRVAGSAAPQWGTYGAPVDTLAVGLGRPAIVADGAGGAIVAWPDFRADVANSKLYAQRRDAAGTALWPAGGVPIAIDGSYQDRERLLADGAGGLFAVWPGVLTLDAQHVGGDGVPLWTSVGLKVDDLNVTTSPALAADGAGGLLVVYVAAGAGSANSIRAQSISPAGTRRWGAAGAAVCTAGGARGLPVVLGDGHGGLTAAWLDGRSGNGVSALYAQHLSYAGLAGDSIVPPPPAPPLEPPTALALSAAWPSPAHAGATVAWTITLPASAHVRLGVIDASGRRVRTLADGPHAAGTWTASWDGRDEHGHAVRAGVFFARLEAGGRTATRKLVVAP